METINQPLADASDMFAVHTMFRREFGLMPGLIRAVVTSDEPRTNLVADHVSLVCTILGIHHSGEDHYIWPLLLQRCPEETASIVGVMEKQHEGLHLGLERVAESIALWREGACAQARDALAATIDRLVPLLNEHLTVEEQSAVPLIEKYLTAAEYGLTVQEGAAVVPPDKMATVFGMMMYESAPSVIDGIVAEMPAEIRPVIEDLATTAYAAYAKQLYGTATPPRKVAAPVKTT